jgi:hypothetical protein
MWVLHECRGGLERRLADYLHEFSILKKTVTVTMIYLPQFRKDSPADVDGRQGSDGIRYDLGPSGADRSIHRSAHQLIEDNVHDWRVQLAYFGPDILLNHRVDLAATG